MNQIVFGESNAIQGKEAETFYFFGAGRSMASERRGEARDVSARHAPRISSQTVTVFSDTTEDLVTEHAQHLVHWMDKVFPHCVALGPYLDSEDIQRD